MILINADFFFFGKSTAIRLGHQVYLSKGSSGTNLSVIPTWCCDLDEYSNLYLYMGYGYQTWILDTPSGDFREHSATDAADVIVMWSLDLDKYSRIHFKKDFGH